MELAILIGIGIFIVFIIMFIDSMINKFIYEWERNQNTNIFQYLVDILIFFYRLFKGFLYVVGVLILLNMIFGNDDNDCNNDCD